MSTLGRHLQRTVRAITPDTFFRAPQFTWLNERYEPTITSNTLVGVEIECENVRLSGEGYSRLETTVQAAFTNYWQTKEDGSLRNRGMEFVTPTGMTAQTASQALPLLEDVFVGAYPRIEANSRTGVHVHVNCLDKTPQQIASLFVLYSLLERSLFLFSGERTENIFCVQVRDSFNNVGPFIRAARKGEGWKTLVALARNTPKYLAFNFGALANFGTVEFRHAKGTNRPRSLVPWLDTLVTLCDYATAQDLEKLVDRVRALNTTSEYEALANECLPRHFIRTVGQPEITADMRDGCTFVKKLLIAPEEVDLEDPSLPPQDAPGLVGEGVRRDVEDEIIEDPPPFVVGQRRDVEGAILGPDRDTPGHPLLSAPDHVAPGREEYLFFWHGQWHAAGIATGRARATLGVDGMWRFPHVFEDPGWANDLWVQAARREITEFQTRWREEHNPAAFVAARDDPFDAVGPDPAEVTFSHMENTWLRRRPQRIVRPFIPNRRAR